MFHHLFSLLGTAFLRTLIKRAVGHSGAIKWVRWSKYNKDHQRITVDPMFMIIQSLRSFITAVTPTTVIPTAVTSILVIFPKFTWIFLNCPYFTLICLDWPWFNGRYLNSMVFTSIYMNLPECTCIYMNLPELTWI